MDGHQEFTAMKMRNFEAFFWWVAWDISGLISRWVGSKGRPESLALHRK
jgi:hypothetical protein